MSSRSFLYLQGAPSLQSTPTPPRKNFQKVFYSFGAPERHIIEARAGLLICGLYSPIMKYYERHTKGTFSALRNILYERFVMDFLSPLDYTAWQRIDTNRLQYMGIPERNNIKEYVGIFRYSDNDAKVEIVLAYNEEQAEAKLHKLSDWNNDRYELRIYKRTL